MKIFDKFEIVEPYPALYIPKKKILVVADLHLGIERILSKQGFHIPKFQFEEIKNDIEDLIKLREVEEIVINGDLKHQLSKANYSEWKEINKLLNFLKEEVKKISITKGNHDNYLIYSTREYDIPLKDYLIRDDILITHGNKNFDFGEINYIIIGHDHPVLTLRDRSGRKEKMQCFIYGKYNGKKIVMIPAFSKLTKGCRVNELEKDIVHSPVLKGCNVGEFEVIGVDKAENLCLKFPKIKEIQLKL